VEDREGAAKLGLRLGLVSLAMVFLGLIGSYIILRAGMAEWPPQGVRLNLPLGAINTLVILASSAALETALRRSRRGGSEAAGICLQLGAALAFAFLCLQALQYYWLMRNFGQTISSSQFGTWFYTMTGLHAIHLLAGEAWLFALLFRARKRTALAVDLCATYWHFVTLIWLILFGILYLV
jgi:cytochrome c oxidase subunit 3